MKENILINFKTSLFNTNTYNKFFYNFFEPGVINLNISYNNKILTINNLSLLIKPENKNDIILKIDTIDSFTINLLNSYDNLLIAKYKYIKNNKTYCEFSIVNEKTIQSENIILCKILFLENGNISSLDYSAQNIAKINLISTNTIYPYVKRLDGYEIGYNYNQIPINNEILNNFLNVEKINSKPVDEYVIYKKEEENLTDNTLITNQESITVPDFLNLNDINSGTNYISEYLNGYKIQPQDGITVPGNNNQIPINNTILQKNLNSELLEGKYEREFANSPHTHFLNEITNSTNYKKVKYISNNKINSDSIENNSISNKKIEKIFYDNTTKTFYAPYIETGTFTLNNNNEITINYTKTIKNPRIILQKMFDNSGINGLEKRNAFITYYDENQFKCKHMGYIENNNGIYIGNKIDPNSITYQYFIIGETE